MPYHLGHWRTWPVYIISLHGEPRMISYYKSDLQRILNKWPNEGYHFEGPFKLDPLPKGPYMNDLISDQMAEANKPVIDGEPKPEVKKEEVEFVQTVDTVGDESNPRED